MQFFLLLIVGAATLAIFATTGRGREIAKRIGFRDRVKGAAPSEDVAFLLSACGDDPKEAARLVALERSQYSDLSEADHYRRAIRKIIAAREP
jgi:hypothetical protein